MNTYDVAVIGGGAAGLTAAIVLLRARRRVVVIDSGDPRNAPAARMHGFLSRDGMPPADLLATGRNEVSAYGGTLLAGTVTAIDPGFVVRLADSTAVRARRILVATGLRDEIPDIPGVKDRWGKDVLHCPYCHGYEVRDRALGVLGGGTEAVAHALLIRQWSDDVSLFSHTDVLDNVELEVLAARGVRVIPGAISHLAVAEDRLVGVQLIDGTLVPRAAVFVRPRFVPNSQLLAHIGCDIDDQGWVRHEPTGRTSVAGVYVAGNASDPRAQVITAAGQGSAVAIAVNADLVDEDVAAAITAHRSN